MNASDTLLMHSVRWLGDPVTTGEVVEVVIIGTDTLIQLHLPFETVNLQSAISLRRRTKRRKIGLQDLSLLIIFSFLPPGLFI